MAEYHIIKLTNLSPLHLGTGKENYDFSASQLQSDTLSAALASIRCQQGKTNDIKKFMESFTVSSAFPFFRDRLYMPKPLGRLEQIYVSGKEEHEYRKKLKKVKYIDIELWNKLINGENICIEDYQIQNGFIVIGHEKPTTYKSQVVQRVTVPRNDGEDAQPFFFNWQYFHPDSGLFCILDCNVDMLQEITDLFTSLGENGLGTDKNIGGGKFTIETCSIHIADIQEPKSMLLLSTYIPTEEELSSIDLSNSKYSLISRDGYMAGSNQIVFRHLRKRSVYMFDYGSLLSTTKPLKGKTINLAPAWNDERMHPVYRNGHPICIPVKL